MTGQDRELDSFDDAPARALQRMVGRRPVTSAAILTAINAVIGIHTGLSAWDFPVSSELGRLGVILVWFALMILLPVMCWTFWVASRLRWIRGQIMATPTNDDGSETARLIRSSTRLVIWSDRSRLVANWLLRIAIVMALIGLGLMIRALSK